MAKKHRKGLAATILVVVMGLCSIAMTTTASAAPQIASSTATPAGLQAVFSAAAVMTPAATEKQSAEANHELMPGGINKVNAKAGWSQFNSRTFVDPNLRHVMAQEANVTSYNPADYRVVGYGRASPGTANSSVLNDGRVVPASNTSNCFVGAKVLIVIHKVTGAKLEICTACGNPRLRRLIQQIPQRPWTLGTVMSFQRHVSKPVYCPNGQRAGTLNVLVHGTVRGRTWGTLRGSMKAQMRLQLNLAVQAEVKLKCAVQQPVAPPPSCSAVNSPGAIVCSTVWVTVICGNLQIAFSGSDATSVTATATQWAQANCSTPPTISPPSPTPPTPPCSTSPRPKFCDPPGPQPPPTVPGPNPADGQKNPDGTPPASGPADPNGNPPSNNGGTQCPPGLKDDGNGGCIPA